jgi:hypothetical protein
MLKGHETRLSSCEIDMAPFKNILIKSVYEEFKCSKCGSQHLMEIKIKCTECDAERWWGYWPK